MGIDLAILIFQATVGGLITLTAALGARG